MRPATSVGRMIGLLLLVQLVGLTLGFMLLLLFRFALVPRVLAGFGLIMVMVHATGIVLPVLAGYSSVQPMAYAMALSYLVLGTWLVAKGFAEGRRT